ncbi:hypothetical protein PMAYCL1PPCAC_27797, partial [Pristionchus mayeri]
ARLLYRPPDSLLVTIGHEIALGHTAEREKHRLLAEIQNVRPDLIQGVVTSSYAYSSNVDDLVRDHSGKVGDRLGIHEVERRLRQEFLRSRKVCSKFLLEHLV